jgi:hypothetical protein
MTVEGERFITQMLQAIRAEIGDMGRRMTSMELRQNASEHFEQGMMAHIASMHATLDELKSDVRRVKQRLELVAEED